MPFPQTSADPQLVRQVCRFYPPPTAAAGVPCTIEIFDAAQNPERLHHHEQAAERCFASRNLAGVAQNRKTTRKTFPALIIEARLDGALFGGGKVHKPSLGSCVYPNARYQTYVILGDAKRWRDDLAAWVLYQGDRAPRLYQGAIFEIGPMRSTS